MISIKNSSDGNITGKDGEEMENYILIHQQLQHYLYRKTIGKYNAVLSNQSEELLDLCPRPPTTSEKVRGHYGSMFKQM